MPRRPIRRVGTLRDPRAGSCPSPILAPPSSRDSVSGNWPPRRTAKALERSEPGRRGRRGLRPSRWPHEFRRRLGNPSGPFHLRARAWAVRGWVQVRTLSRFGTAVELASGALPLLLTHAGKRGSSRRSTFGCRQEVGDWGPRRRLPVDNHFVVVDERRKPRPGRGKRLFPAPGRELLAPDHVRLGLPQRDRNGLALW